MNDANHESPHFLAPPLEKDSSDPFKHDFFNRKLIAENLTVFASSFADKPFVLGINGEWGSGKSKFVEMWNDHLQQHGFKTLLFNAWENDHSNDPFASIFTEFRQLSETQNKTSVSPATKLWDKVSESSLPILKRAATGVLKNLTLGILDLQSSDMEAAIAEIVEATAKQTLDNCENEKQSIQKFRDALKNYVNSISISNKPVIYFIDELDRCRPTFALAVLERIKHLLNVPGVFFVFAWDRKQLNNTIKAIYGEQVDATGYLTRFIDLEFNLPRASYQQSINALMIRHGLIDYLRKNGRSSTATLISRTFPGYAQMFGLSLRDQEKVFTSLSVMLRLFCNDNDDAVETVLVLVILKYKRPEVYEALRHIKNYDDLIRDILPKAFGPKFMQDLGAFWEGCLIQELDQVERSQRLNELNSSFKIAKGDEFERIRAVHSAFVYSQANKETHSGFLGRLFSFLEFSGAFWSSPPISS